MLKNAFRRFLPVVFLACAALAETSLPAAPTPASSPAGAPAAAPGTRTASQGAPLVFRGRTLLRIYEKIRTLTPEERVHIVEARIERIAGDSTVTTESIGVMEEVDASEIVAGDHPIMPVTDADAAAAGRNRSELAAEYATIIREAIHAAREETGANSRLRGFLTFLVATAALVALLMGIGRGKRWLLGKVESLQGARPVKIQNLELIPAEKVERLFTAIVRGAWLVAVLVLFYIYLPIVLSLFPETRNFAAGFLGYFLDPIRTLGRALVAYLPNLLFVLVVAVITRYVLKGVRIVFDALGRKGLVIRGFHPEWAQPTYSIARLLILAFAAVVIFPYLPGATSPAFQGISIFLGILVSLGSTTAVANMVAGTILTYMRPFRVGDVVQITDTLGFIIEKDLLVTRIRTVKNVEITVPNSLVLGSHIVNYSTSVGDPHLILHTSVTIGYDAEWRKVHQLLIAAAEATEHILKEPRPFVLQTSLDDFYVTYQLNAYTDRPQEMPNIYSQLHENIQDRFNEGGVEIMSPHYSQLRDGNKVTIPSPYLPAGYEPGSLRVRQVAERGKGPLGES
jgi:small-conductance mechanosensitive channel